MTGVATARPVASIVMEGGGWSLSHPRVELPKKDKTVTHVAKITVMQKRVNIDY